MVEINIMHTREMLEKPNCHHTNIEPGAFETAFFHASRNVKLV
jgi:hypothetical protein